jgi:hypothetical protein
MEGRGLAKGNLPQQNASRTPSRKDAPSALERVRQTAGKDKKLRFTALLHHIYNLETLRMALFLFRFQVGRLWYRALSRRSQNGRLLWDRMRRLITRWLPVPTVCHPYSSTPHERHHLRQEPDAGIPPVRIRGGGYEQS